MDSLKTYASKFHNLVYFFFFYSFLGWSIEVIITTIKDGHYSSRGFLHGPFCIIYGFGALFIIIFLTKFKDNILLFYFYSTVSTTILEYATGLVLNKIYHRTWWDYSNLILNLNGYISLISSLFWGLLSILIIYKVHPRIERFVQNIPQKAGILMFYSISVFFIINSLISVLAAFSTF